MRKFILMNTEGENYYYECSFSGRMTKGRYKAIMRYIRSRTIRSSNCHHEHDCCGCLCYRTFSFQYKYNQVVITCTESFNY